MIVGTHNAVSQQEKVNMVLRAAKDLSTSLEIKRQRQRQGAGVGWMPLGPVEQIIFEVDRDCSIDDLRSMGAQQTGRRIYWPDPHHAPMIARTMPEEDLIFTKFWPLRRGMVALPDVPDPTYIVKNPYKVDQKGVSQLKDIDDLETPRMLKQLPEKLASSKSGRFLVFQPIAQIILFSMGRGKGLQYSAFGSPRMPISSLSGFDDRKMALLVDPYNGEAFFSGGRYQLHAPDVTE